MFSKQMHQENDAEKEVLDLKRMQVSSEKGKKIYFIFFIFNFKKYIIVTSTGIIYLFIYFLLFLCMCMESIVLEY